MMNVAARAFLTVARAFIMAPDWGARLIIMADWLVKVGFS